MHYPNTLIRWNTIIVKQFFNCTEAWVYIKTPEQYYLIAKRNDIQDVSLIIISVSHRGVGASIMDVCELSGNFY